MTSWNILLGLLNFLRQLGLHRCGAESNSVYGLGSLSARIELDIVAVRNEPCVRDLRFTLGICSVKTCLLILL